MREFLSAYEEQSLLLLLPGAVWTLLPPRGHDVFLSLGCRVHLRAVIFLPVVCCCSFAAISQLREQQGRPQQHMVVQEQHQRGKQQNQVITTTKRGRGQARGRAMASTKVDKKTAPAPAAKASLKKTSQSASRGGSQTARGGAKGLTAKAETAKKSKEELDAELNKYFLSTKAGLDSQLEEYQRARTKISAPAAVASSVE